MRIEPHILNRKDVHQFRKPRFPDLIEIEVLNPTWKHPGINAPEGLATCGERINLRQHIVSDTLPTHENSPGQGKKR